MILRPLVHLEQPCDRSLIIWTKCDQLATNNSIRSRLHSHSHSCNTTTLIIYQYRQLLPLYIRILCFYLIYREVAVTVASQVTVSWSVGLCWCQLVSVSQLHSRPTTLSSTVLCLKISLSSVHIRSYWHNNICNAFF